MCWKAAICGSLMMLTLAVFCVGTESAAYAQASAWPVSAGYF